MFHLPNNSDPTFRNTYRNVEPIEKFGGGTKNLI